MSISRNKLYFINFSRTVPGIFSSAIDCFLEIWFRRISRIFTPTIRIYILGLLEHAERQYLMLIERSYNINSGIGIVNPSSSMNMAQALNGFSLNPISDSSASYFCKNPKENSSFSKYERIQQCGNSDSKHTTSLERTTEKNIIK